MENLNPSGEEAVKTFFAKEERPEYGLVTVFLSVPKEELIRRVREGPQLPGKYQGKVNELEASFKNYTDRYGDPTTAGYHLTIDAVRNGPQVIADMLKQKLA